MDVAAIERELVRDRIDHRLLGAAAAQPDDFPVSARVRAEFQQLDEPVVRAPPD
jgi:hypothetical protein